MDKITYLAELAEGLARWVPTRERQDILRYYAEYFEEAGPEREAEVIAELGDPWALSCRLAVEGGYVTQENAASWRPGKKRTRFLIGTAVGLAVFALVFGTGLLAFNVVRTVRHRVYTAVDPVTVVDWGEELIEGGGFNVAYVDDPGTMGYYYMDGESVTPFSSIDVDISLGDIEVVAGDDFTLSINRGEAMIGYEPELEIRDGVLKLRDSSLPQGTQVDGWDDLKNLFSADWLAVDVLITVPEGTALDRISVKTGLGDVQLYGIKAGTITVETGLGDVECYEIRSAGQLDLRTGVGDMVLVLTEARGGLSISLESGTGDIEADLCGFEKDYSYTLESGLGLVTVNGAVRGSKAEKDGYYKLNAESGTGSVNVYFSGDRIE